MAGGILSIVENANQKLMMGILLCNLIVGHTHDKVDRVFSRFLAILNGIDTTDVASVLASRGRGWLAHNDGADESADEAADNEGVDEQSWSHHRPSLRLVDAI